MAASESDLVMRTIARRGDDELGPAGPWPIEPDDWLRVAEANVELHVLNHEWYFTSGSAIDVATLLGPDVQITCLGTPTVAAQLVHLGRPVTLVDSNHLNRLRFPELDRAMMVIWGDVARVLQLPLAQAVVFDAPWYSPDVERWLGIANRICVVGGKIVFALFPEWIRSTARAERHRLLDLAGAIGTVSVDRGRLVYTTPRFEAEALFAAGVPPAMAWRRADLVVVTKTTAGSEFELKLADGGDHWETFLIGSQVVMLRKRPIFNPSTELAAIPGCPGDVLPSVSRRDPRRTLIGLWTSRNRVASVSNVKHVRRALGRLAAHKPSSQRGNHSTRYIDRRLRELLLVG